MATTNDLNYFLTQIAENRIWDYTPSDRLLINNMDDIAKKIKEACENKGDSQKEANNTSLELMLKYTQTKPAIFDMLCKALIAEEVEIPAGYKTESTADDSDSDISDSESTSKRAKTDSDEETSEMSETASFALPANILDIAFAAIVQRVKANDPTLTHLNLGYNFITDSDVATLASALEGNTVITSIDLRGNFITDKGAIALSRVLEKNTTLTALDLTGNDIEYLGASALARALKDNYTLDTISIDAITTFDPSDTKGTLDMYCIRNLMNNHPMPFSGDIDDGYLTLGDE